MDRLLFVFLVLVVQLTYVSTTTAQQAGSYSCSAATVKRVIELNHCNPRPDDNNFRKDVWTIFINSMDPEHMYFFAKDVDSLSAAFKLLTDILENKNQELLKRIIPLSRARLSKADSLIRLDLQTPFNYTSDDKISLPSDSSRFAITEKDYADRWYKLLKHNTLQRLAEIAGYDTTATDSIIMSREKNEREIVRKIEERKISKILQHPWGFETYISALLCNAVAQAYDPHSEFLPAVEKENFVGEVSGEGYSFGLQLNENEQGEVIIEHVVPGSPASKSGMLGKNDVLLEMQWNGKPAIDLAGADIDEVEDLLAGLNHDRMQLTVRKADGIRKTVSLIKEKIPDDESFVKSFVLNGPDKIGYILLPGFYTEWETSPGQSCATDVVGEINKLKGENVSGIILDLRDNGGGSMDEAVCLAGIFIDDGVLGYSRDKSGKASPLKDPNRGVVYDGPLLIMVNTQSASATEFVASAMQDYKRAIIVGSPTFGKASIQQVIPVDSAFKPSDGPERYEQSNSDFLKVTIGKLYRVNGKSNQLYGVQPDIVLPDVSEILGYHEYSLKCALPRDSVRGAFRFRPLRPLPISELRLKSIDRISNSKSFQTINEAKQLFSSVMAARTKPVSLQYGPYIKMGKNYIAETKRLKSTLELDSIRSFKIINTSSDQVKLQNSNDAREENAATIRDIVKDIYINESFFILSDFIDLKK